MKPKAASVKMWAGMIFALGGLIIGANGLVSGPRAFALGATAVVFQCISGLVLIGIGGKMVYDSKRVA